MFKEDGLGLLQIEPSLIGKNLDIDSKKFSVI